MNTWTNTKIVTVLILMLSLGKNTLCRGFVSKLPTVLVPARLFSVQNPSTLACNTLFSNGASFKEIGVSEVLLTALSERGLRLATPIQKMTFTPIKSGVDTIIGSETGSGKTLAYLLPLIDAYLSLDIIDIPNYPCGVILAPTKELCWQIEDMAKGITEQLQKQGLNFRIEAVTEVTGRWKFPEESAPTFLVCTPRYLASFVRGPVINEEALFESIRYLVLDEADMLLDGSYVKDVETVMDALKVVRRGLIREGLVQVHEQVTQFVLAAATLPSAGLKSVQTLIRKKFPRAKVVWTDNMHAHHPTIDQEFIMVEGPASAAARGDVLIPGSIPHANLVARSLLKAAQVEGEGKEEGLGRTRRGGAGYTSAGATAGGATAARVSAEDVAHRAALSAAEAAVVNSAAHLSMVFLNTAETAKLFADSLRSTGVNCVEFHKLCRAADRETNLRKFRDGQVKVIVCTDSAARGLDLPQVRLVVQAEFALNVVQHQHRVGRASRGGRVGCAANFVFPSSHSLVSSLLQQHPSQLAGWEEEEEKDGAKDAANDEGAGLTLAESSGSAGQEPPEMEHTSQSAGIAHAFSRRRGFRRNLKRQQTRLLSGDE